MNDGIKVIIGSALFCGTVYVGLAYIEYASLNKADFKNMEAIVCLSKDGKKEIVVTKYSNGSEYITDMQNNATYHKSMCRGY